MEMERIGTVYVGRQTDQSRPPTPLHPQVLCIVPSLVLPVLDSGSLTCTDVLSWSENLLRITSEGTATPICLSPRGIKNPVLTLTKVPGDVRPRISKKTEWRIVNEGNTTGTTRGFYGSYKRRDPTTHSTRETDSM